MNEPLNLLALDGGGIRGVSMLLILDEIMKRIQHDKRLANPPRPCEYFHLIGGTSTGGLIALMLGRLRMTTGDALRTYNEIAGSVFGKSNRKHFFKDGAFKATTLEKQIQSLVAEKALGEYILYEKDEAGATKTFVCTVPATNMAHPRLFRSYTVRENAGTNCKIWEAARATTAAPTFFKRMTIMDDRGAREDFLDGGLRFNNPAELVLSEAFTVFGGASKLGCLVSVGTGHPGTIGLSQPDTFQKILPTEMVGVLKRIATNCEQTAHELAGRFRQLPNRYFRYSVSHGIGSISLEEWKKMDEIQVHTKAYLAEIEVSSSINELVEIFCRASEIQRPELLLQSICLVIPESAAELTSRLPVKYQPRSSSLFTGRDDFLNALEEFFTDQGPGQHLRREYLLFGMGGAGKTQIALRFAENYQQKYEHVFWIDASNRDTLEQSYKNIALKIGTIADKKVSLEEALQKLECYRGRWLLLFDGADSLEDILGLFPPGTHGDIVYTSRNPMLRRLPASQTRHVAEMDHDEAPALLSKSARLNISSEDYQEQGLAIIEELGHLALAIDQAGAYIASGECCLDDFLDVFNAHRQHLLQNDAYKGASESDQAVYATWDLSYAAIRRQANAAVNEAFCQGPRAALQILRVFPFFHNEGIMEDIFRFAAENSKSQTETECEVDGRFPSALLQLRPDGRWESQSFRQGIQTLLSFSLVGQESFQRRFFMHRLVHLWAYDCLTGAEKECFCDQAGDVLQRSITWRSGSSDYTFRRELLPHVASFQRQSSLSSVKPKEEGIAKFALVFSEAGRWKEAEELQVQVMKIRKSVLGEEHPDTLISINNLASIYWDQGRWKEAEELQIQVIKIRKRVLGEEHPDSLISINNLASTYRDQGRWKEAEELQIQMMKIRKRVLGEEHPYTLSGIGNLALIYRDQGRWKEAEELQIQVMKTIKKILGEEHPNTLINMNNLALIYGDQGRWKEAEELQIQVIKIRKSVLGEEHPNTLISINNLASIYWDQGRWKEAEELQMQIIETRKRVLGEEHPYTLNSIGNLASTYRNQGRWKEAEELQMQVMETRKRVLGEEHPHTLTSMNNLAIVWQKQGRSAEAIPLMERCFQLRKQIIGPGHPDTKVSLEALHTWRYTEHVLDQNFSN